MDEEQFQLLYEATARPVHSYLLAMTGRKDVADDLLQEVYFRFFQRHFTEEALTDKRRYLFRIATNLLRDRWRRRKEEQWPTTLDFGRSYDLDARIDVRRMLESLKPRDGELLWLAYIEGMNHAEIALITGLGEPSIRPLLFHARRKAAGLLRLSKEIP
ncbi:MAG TPA: RNA polymerase sigma factor [Acidobacteriaceae bacterium]|jgi:RNA polymerase sigma-70 factor (ECF subfamily)